MAFSDGAWYDPQDGLFKLWYQASYEPARRSVCLAVSQDGIHWEKPAFDVRPGSNIVLPDSPDALRDSVTVWLDHEESNPQKRFKLWRSTKRKTGASGQDWTRWRLMLYLSPDGVHWTQIATRAPWAPRLWFATAVYRDRMWVLGGWSKEHGNFGDVWFTEDGAHWTELKSNVIWKSRHAHAAYVFHDKLWVAGGHADPLNSEVWTLEIPGGL
jgi:hypothetical protein